MRAYAIAVAGLTLLGVSHSQAAPNQTRSAEASAASVAAITDFSAAKRRKKHKQARPASSDSSFAATRAMTHGAEPAQIACLRGGCQPVPRGCLREPERSFDGTPTAFDAIVCPPR